MAMSNAERQRRFYHRRKAEGFKRRGRWVPPGTPRHLPIRRNERKALFEAGRAAGLFAGMMGGAEQAARALRQWLVQDPPERWLLEDWLARAGLWGAFEAWLRASDG